jgi:hypothetical protein
MKKRDTTTAMLVFQTKQVTLPGQTVSIPHQWCHKQLTLARSLSELGEYKVSLGIIMVLLMNYSEV